MRLTILGRACVASLVASGLLLAGCASSHGIDTVEVPPAPPASASPVTGTASSTPKPASAPRSYLGLRVGLSVHGHAGASALPAGLTKLSEVHDAKGANAVTARRGAEIVILAVSAAGVVTDEVLVPDPKAQLRPSAGCEIGGEHVLVGLVPAGGCDRESVAERAWAVRAGKLVEARGEARCMDPCL